MILAYGNYRHALGEASLAIRRETLFGPAGVPRALRERWTIHGMLQADSPIELTTAIAELEAAYTVGDQSATLFLPDGVTPTAHRLDTSQALGGVRVARRPSFPRGAGSEYATYRSYTIELEAEFANHGSEAALLDWHETVSFSGGGPRWAYLATLAGAPIQQTLQQQTPYRATQSGLAVGHFGYPQPADPLWPSAWHQDQGGVWRELPRRVGSGPHAADLEYAVRWTYEFESASALLGTPTPRPH